MIFSKKEWEDALKVRYGEELFYVYRDATVAVCGLGGLGSNVAVALARAGVGKLILIDFDRVDITNLHRQQYKVCQVGLSKTDAMRENIREIAPYMELVTYNEKLTDDNVCDFISEADIVCEAFDDAKAKAMLVNNVLCNCPDKYVVSASGMAGLESVNTIRTRRIGRKLYICGDSVSDVANGIGLISSRVMACASHQAHIILRILTHMYEP